MFVISPREEPINYMSQVVPVPRLNDILIHSLFKAYVVRHKYWNISLSMDFKLNERVVKILGGNRFVMTLST